MFDRIGNPNPHRILDMLGVVPVINAGGPNTKHSGSRPRPEVLETMTEMAEAFVNIDEFLIASGKEIAKLVNAESATITSGASGGLVVQSAAAIARDNPKIIASLPITLGVPNELIIQKSQRFIYDHLYLIPGAKFVEVGDENGCDPQQVIDNITNMTAGIVHLESPFKNRGTVPLNQLVEIANGSDLPVLVDAASMLPPRENLTKFTAQGASLVSFSGGKAVRGPQSTGFLIGTPEWIEYARLNNAPNPTAARAQKVSKEEIAGLITALKIFVNENESEETKTYKTMMQKVVDQIIEIPGINTSVMHNYDHYIPHAVIDFNETWKGPDSDEIAKILMNQTPRIFVTSGYTGARSIWIDPLNIQDGELDLVISRVHEVLLRASSGGYDSC